MHKQIIKSDEYNILDGGRSVPWGIFEGHEAQAYKNHSQSLEELNSRGGTSYQETYYILKDEEFPYTGYVSEEEAKGFVLNTVKEYVQKQRRPSENINGWPLKKVLQTVLSPDRVKEYSVQGLSEYLTENNIVKDEDDIKLIIIEALQKALADDDEFPVHYYKNGEPMSEEGKKTHTAVMTDELVESMKRQ